MADVLSYADPHAWSRVRHEVWARGGRVVVPGLGSPAVGWALAGAGGLLAAGGLGLWALVGDNCLSMAAVAAGVILMMAGGFRVNFPGGEPAAAFTYADT